ncbi:uncharacterized protein CTHT_0021720 [Thermochaetoides thermophila DSM 1495]|uniref:BTB domain-containing protein n=1 Tax=Chaetomium thermophilum (strain DSM 1495 / CBS 144.50 / IMI 039719) TaxID=759272 RepID=G0S3L8_CHATD|nr:hypothetical protein CTHT_0021720 [Thermochaetoides thermophila DSM 1495]EGS20345.1 hypothetical protein CTHT_0021720 [Thermochaetoides thermophila DSM 1495]
MADNSNDEMIVDTPAAIQASNAAAGNVEMAESGAAVAASENAAGNPEGSTAEASVPEQPDCYPANWSGENKTILTAHQALLVQSPFFAEACAEFTDDGSPRQIELPGEDINAIGCFFEFLYTGEYFPKKIPGQRQLERHPSIPERIHCVNSTAKGEIAYARYVY